MPGLACVDRVPMSVVRSFQSKFARAHAEFVRTQGVGQAVCARARLVCGDTAFLIAIAQERHGRRRAFRGGSDADGDIVRIIASLLRTDRVCVDCIARDVTVPAVAVKVLLERAEQTFVLASQTRACAGCETRTVVWGVRGTARFPFGTDSRFDLDEETARPA